MNKKLKLTLIFIIIFSVIAAALLPVFKAIYWTKAGKNVQIAVDSGQSTRIIAKNLENEEIIASAWIFASFVYAKHWLLQTGVYQIESDMNMVDIANLLREGRIQEHLITIPEGWRVTQIDEALVQKGIIRKGELTKIAAPNEGYLFPDTYRLALDANASQVKNLMLENFKTKTKGLKITSQTIILASIVEREAKFDQDRAKIAGVYLNRLALGMKLDADPTIQYGKGNWEPISAADYKSFQNPYNTYLNAGLPPGPICNPGLKSIQAVLNPEKSDYYYFFHKTDGSAVFSETYEEHLAKLKNP